MKKVLRTLARDRKGATAIEYGLIAAFVALGLVGALPAVKSQLTAKFNSISSALQAN